MRVAFVTVLASLVSSAEALSSSSQQQQSLKFALQQCLSPQDVLQRVACELSPQTDPDGSIASLVLVRLAKQIISLDNQNHYAQHDGSQWKREAWNSNNEKAWKQTCSVLANRSMMEPTGITIPWTPLQLESAVDGLKAASIISRVLPETSSSGLWSPLLASWEEQALKIHTELVSHQLTGIKWAYDTFALHMQEATLPTVLHKRYEDLKIPFRIIPACLKNDVPELSIPNLVNQVDFSVDQIKTISNEIVAERRQTAWEGDEGVIPFSYSGKSMPTRSWSPLVQAVRDCLVTRTGQYYNGCLLNLYPDGGSGMRYHSDPDQGTLWDYATVVVSVGATRKFAFRDIPSESDKSIHQPNSRHQRKQQQQQQPHNFVVMEGDVTEMLNDCQIRFQHTVKTADDKNDEAARASMVFKRTRIKSEGTTPVAFT